MKKKEEEDEEEEPSRNEGIPEGEDPWPASTTLSREVTVGSLAFTSFYQQEAV